MNHVRPVLFASILLLALLPSPLHAQRPSATSAPSKLEDSAKRKALRVLRAAREGEAKTAAAKAMGDLGDASAVASLRAALEASPNDPFVYAALVWLGVSPFVADARAAVLDPGTAVPVVTLYAAALARRPDPAVQARVRALWEDASQDPLERLWAGCILLDMGEKDLVEPLRAYLGDKDPYVAALAASALAGAGDESARARLHAVLRDRRAAQDDVAAMALGERPSRDSLAPLRAALDRARDPHDQVWLAWAVLKTLGHRFADAP